MDFPLRRFCKRKVSFLIVFICRTFNDYSSQYYLYPLCVITARSFLFNFIFLIVFLLYNHSFNSYSRHFSLMKLFSFLLQSVMGYYHKDTDKQFQANLNILMKSTLACSYFKIIAFNMNYFQRNIFNKRKTC